MSELLRFVLLGLAIGALYALTAQGLVLIYRGSGVVNLAQGAFAMVGAFVYYESTGSRGLADRSRLGPRHRHPRRARRAHPPRGDAPAPTRLGARAPRVDVGRVLLPDRGGVPDLGVAVRARPVAAARHDLRAVRHGEHHHGRPSLDHRDRDRHHRRPVRRVPPDPLRRRHRGGGREPTGREHARALPGSHRGGQLGRRRRAGRPRGGAHRTGAVPQRRRVELHGASRPRRRAGGPVPFVLGDARRCVRHRDRGVAAQQLHRPPRPVRAVHEQQRAPLRAVHGGVRLALGRVPHHRHRARGRAGPRCRSATSCSTGCRPSDDRASTGRRSSAQSR